MNHDNEQFRIPFGGIMSSSSAISHSNVSQIINRGMHTASLGIKEIKEGALWLDRKIINLTNKLPRPLDVICRDVYRASPYIAMTLFLPMSLYVAAFIGVLAYKAIRAPEGSHPSCRNLSNGTAMAMLYLGTKNVVTGSLTANPITTVFGAGQLLGATYTLLKTGFLFDALGIRRPSRFHYEV
jgi:hypothetical protein